MENKEYTTIRIKIDTWKILNRFKENPNQGFDEVVEQLVADQNITKILQEQKEKENGNV